MNLKNVIAVSGEGGLFKLVTSKNNGLILSNLDTGRSSFFSVRTYQFTPLETVGIYTMTDTVDLSEVFERMTKDGQIPERPNQLSNDELMAYFKTIVPDYDPIRVHGKDVKKVIKWYQSSKQHGLLDASDEEE